MISPEGDNIRVGVIGVGHIGREHARVYAQLPNATLVGVFDAHADTARKIAAKHNSTAFSSIEGLLESVDAVSIATPTVTHYNIGRMVLGNDRHVLIEKPITNNTVEARELVQLSEKNRLVLQVGHIERFNPVLRALEKILTRPRFIEAHRLSPYPGRSTDIGVVLDLMIHDLDVILQLVRSPIAHVDAVGVPVLSTSEDIANARIRFDNGCVANITTSRISPEKMRKIRIFQDDAYVSLDYQKQEGEIYRKHDGEIKREKILVEKDEPLKLQLASFIECVRLKKTPVVSGTQATEALSVAMNITDQITAQPAIGG